MKTSITKQDFINLPLFEQLKYTNKEIICITGFVSGDIKRERKRIAQFTDVMQKNPRPEYKQHFSDNPPYYSNN